MDRRAFLSAAAACSVVSASSSQLARAQPSQRFAAAAGYSASRDGVSFLVVRNGIVLAEHYPAGDATTRWPIGAGTRAFMPLLAASLVEDRLLSLDEPVAMTLGDWGAHPDLSTVSVRALISGAVGIAFAPEGPRDLAAAIALQPSGPPGTHFSNDAALYVLFTELARRKLEAAGREQDPARYLTTRTLLPIGCVPIGWMRDASGAPRFDDGVAVSPQGWAQAGELIRREGVWRAQQLADDEVLRAAMRGTFAEARAGYGLWVAGTGRRGPALDVDSDLWRENSPAPNDLVMAAGAGGQRLFISPQDGLIIVRQARSLRADTQWSDAQFLSLLWRDL